MLGVARGLKKIILKKMMEKKFLITLAYGQAGPNYIVNCDFLFVLSRAFVVECLCYPSGAHGFPTKKISPPITDIYINTYT